MGLWEKVRQFSEQGFSSLQRIYRHIRALNKTLLRIEEIDISAQTAIFYCQGIHTVLKMTLAEAVSDHAIISNLSSIQACWLGYYYGKIAMNTSVARKRKDNNFLLCFSQGPFNILSQDRKGYITYIDTKTKKTYTENPVEVSKNEFLISRFDPSQACYIGIISGMNVSRSEKSMFYKRKTIPALKVIK